MRGVEKALSRVHSYRKKEVKMTEKDYLQYIDHVGARQYEEATKLKNSHIPDVLYKYYCLDDDGRLNESKLCYLEKNQIFLSDFQTFNDPFEGKILIFDESKLELKGWDIDLIEEYVDGFVNQWKVTCMTNTDEQNMPMWAYYANNHQGFCVKYELNENQKDFIYPAIYVKERLYANGIVTNMINETVKLKKGNKQPTKDYNMSTQLIFLSMAAKHISWETEKEYRVIHREDKFPAQPNEIFIGIHCKDEYRKRLIQIGKQSGNHCKIYQMKIARNSPKFELQKVEIL